ncbi:MAG TPA: A/G-specific adenine glycosylase [Phycisphaerae bacterium]|jgi:A/G-specific adenine glycosylase|nr:A/G-specific adenine glycosylase [Phycisphaerae bacterium]
MTDSTTPSPQPLAPPATLHHHLLQWYHRAKRDMPWRGHPDPYAIWLSETMLQQTQVETVKPYFSRFLARFPTINSLAEADLQEVLALWAGLGYYRRAKHLHQAARAVVQHHGGRLPDTVEALRTLPGIGRYTAGAIASIAFHRPAPVVDGNVMRVLARLAGYDRDIADPKHHGFFWTLAEEIVSAAPKGHYGDVNQALMELGATICTPPPSRPACLLCPLRESCRAHAEGRQLDLPIKSRKGLVPRIHGIALVLLRPSPHSPDRSEVLLMRRPMDTIWEDMWEFPTLAPPPKPRGTRKLDLPLLARHLADTLGIPVPALVACGRIRHTLTHRSLHLDVVRAHLPAASFPSIALPASPTAGGKRYQATRWVPWPLPQPSPLPIARVVTKIAQAAIS